MKQNDYIAATNLAKLRIADTVLRSVFLQDEAELKRVLVSLSELIAELEKAVQQ